MIYTATRTCVWYYKLQVNGQTKRKKKKPLENRNSDLRAPGTLSVINVFIKTASFQYPKREDPRCLVINNSIIRRRVAVDAVFRLISEQDSRTFDVIWIYQLNLFVFDVASKGKIKLLQNFCNASFFLINRVFFF